MTQSRFVHTSMPPGGGGGGGTQVQRGGAAAFIRISRKEGLFKTSACPRFCKRWVLICTQVRSMGAGNPLTIHRLYAALTPSDSRSDWASESAAATAAAILCTGRAL